jgi:hypothetical protein
MKIALKTLGATLARRLHHAPVGSGRGDTPPGRQLGIEGGGCGKSFEEKSGGIAGGRTSNSDLAPACPRSNKKPRREAGVLLSDLEVSDIRQLLLR